MPVLALLIGIGAVIAWHSLALGATGAQAHGRTAVVGMAALHTVQFLAMWTVIKVYCARWQAADRAALSRRVLEHAVLPVWALVLSTRSGRWLEWLSTPSLVFCFVLAALVFCDFSGHLRTALADRYPLNQDERPLYRRYPPAASADLLLLHIAIAAFFLVASLRLFRPT